MSGQDATARKLTKKDFESDEVVRWCPGCGDYAILAQVTKLLPELGVPRENFVFVSGIGCSSRFPYYVNTYGFHAIHGRAPAIATGLKIIRPELSVWVVTGDGDGLSIGGNHLVHCLRRNVGLKILLFNNRIYGLTKGQFSPTSEVGKRTKSSPAGTVDAPVRPVSLALGAGATFVARTVDVDAKHLLQVLRRAHEHKGTAFIEIMQNCPIFNDGAFSQVSDKDLRAENQLVLEAGKPMIFGKNRDKGLRLGTDLRPEVVSLEKEGKDPKLLVHDETDPALAYLLGTLDLPAFPVPIGVIRCVEEPTYEEAVAAQLKEVQRARGRGSLAELFARGQTWEVTPGKTKKKR